MVIIYRVILGFTLLFTNLSAMANDDMKKIDVQSQFPPLMIKDAPIGGAHPIGGLAHIFIENANKTLAPFDAQLTFHASEEVKPYDREIISPPVVDIPADFSSIHHAVAAGPTKGGVSAAIGLSNTFGEDAAELFVSGLPFGFRPQEFIAWLYEGGGLAIQQEIYDEIFNRSVIVIPVAVNPAQGGGWFPEELPESLAQVCQKPWIVRWPSIPAGVWANACANEGVDTTNLGVETRCIDAELPCPSDNNPITNAPSSLSFGGFKPGSLPHRLALLGHVDAFELNLPYTDVMMIKIALGLEGVKNSDADLSPIIEKTPFLYLNAWHQPFTYVELVINRTVWESLSGNQRSAIEFAAKASALDAWAVGLDRQAEGIEILKQNGAKVQPWPQDLLSALHAETDAYLNRHGRELQAKDNGRFLRVADHMRRYQRAHADYFSYGDTPRWLDKERGGHEKE